MQNLISQSDLKRLLSYDPETGKFTWSSRRQAVVYGAEAGALHVRKKTGRREWRIQIGGRQYLRSRLAWLYMTGTWPAGQVDHIDRNSTNDRWVNLRDATASENQANAGKRRNCRVPLKGVCLHKSGRYQAQIKRGGKTEYLGLYLTAEDAHHAYVAAARRIFGEYARAA